MAINTRPQQIQEHVSNMYNQDPRLGEVSDQYQESINSSIYRNRAVVDNVKDVSKIDDRKRSAMELLQRNFTPDQDPAVAYDRILPAIKMIDKNAPDEFDPLYLENLAVASKTPTDLGMAPMAKDVKQRYAKSLPPVKDVGNGRMEVPIDNKGGVYYGQTSGGVYTGEEENQNNSFVPGDLSGYIIDNPNRIAAMDDNEFAKYATLLPKILDYQSQRNQLMSDQGVKDASVGRLKQVTKMMKDIKSQYDLMDSSKTELTLNNEGISLKPKDADTKADLGSVKNMLDVQTKQLQLNEAQQGSLAGLGLQVLNSSDPAKAYQANKAAFGPHAPDQYDPKYMNSKVIEAQVASDPNKYFIRENNVRTQYNTLTKPYAESITSGNNVLQLIESGDPLSIFAATKAFVRTFDKGPVTEEDFQNINKFKDVLAKVGLTSETWKQLASGQPLNETQIANMKKATQAVLDTNYKQVDNINNEYTNMAIKSGLSADNIIRNFRANPATNVAPNATQGLFDDVPDAQ